MEPWEALVPSVIREIKEETGLDIENVKLCGVKEWFEDGVRSMVFFYKTNCFSGNLQSSEEGEVDVYKRQVYFSFGFPFPHRLSV